MRPPDMPFPVEAEYPIVLAADGAPYSHCLIEHGRVAAHANLWPRVLCDAAHGTRHKVGLVGNVATAENMRGQGLMRRLFAHLAEAARREQLETLILWADTDLHQFYQKFGFRSHGREWRFSFRIKDLRASATSPDRQFLPTATLDLPLDVLEGLLRHRCPTSATLERNAEEYRRLFEIPATTLFLRTDLDPTAGHFIMGKGCDMMNVVHEWGAPTPETAIHGLRDAAEAFGWEEIMMLAPGDLAPTWCQRFQRLAVKSELHYMALLDQPKSKAADALARGFIWGLDSI